MNISIKHFEVNSISSIGSINIGKTILSHNQSKTVATTTEQPNENEQSSAENDRILTPPNVMDPCGYSLLPNPPQPDSTNI